MSSIENIAHKYFRNVKCYLNGLLFYKKVHLTKEKLNCNKQNKIKISEQ